MTVAHSHPQLPRCRVYLGVSDGLGVDGQLQFLLFNLSSGFLRSIIAVRIDCLYNIVAVTLVVDGQNSNSDQNNDSY